MLNPDIAAAMLFVGLSEGWYTGKKLSQFFGQGLENPVGARAMVNPDNNGAAIAVTYRAFVNALRAAGHQPGAVTATIPVIPVETAPLKPPVISTKPANPPTPDTGGVAVQTGGFGAWLKSLFSKKAA
jgi:putative chitinase